MSDTKATNITWDEGRVARSQRCALLGQQGVTLWFTGLSGSGKSTISAAVELALIQRGRPAYRLDGDNVRHGVNKNLGFAPEDRAENIRRVGEISKLFADAGLIALASFISPYRADRELCREMHKSASLAFIEVFVDCPLDEAERRDPKGLYKKARAGLVKDFTGIDAPYEVPRVPDVHLRTDRMSIEEEVAILIAELETRGLIPQR